MIALLCFVLAALATPIKSKHRLEAENVAAWTSADRFKARGGGRVRLTNNDRWFFV
jgi:hypothetical protein